MRYIDAITNEAKQLHTLTMENGDAVTFDLEYVEGQTGWYYSISHPLLTIYRRRLVVSPNMLRAFRRIIPFGLALVSNDGYEPIFKDDFTNGRVQLFTLNETDVDEIEVNLFNG